MDTNILATTSTGDLGKKLVRHRELIEQYCFILDKLLLWISIHEQWNTQSNLITTVLAIILSIANAATVNIVSLKWISMSMVTISTISYLISLFAKYPIKRQHYLSVRTEFQNLLLSLNKYPSNTFDLKVFEADFERLTSEYFDLPISIIKAFQDIYMTWQIQPYFKSDGTKTIRIKKQVEDVVENK